jgi:hypothetical protein
MVSAFVSGLPALSGQIVLGSALLLANEPGAGPGFDCGDLTNY